MRCISTGFALCFGFCMLLPAMPVHAQPPGSYQRSCRDIRMYGPALIALCRNEHGRWQQTRLDQVHRCIGDIGNQNGNLVCNRR